MAVEVGEVMLDRNQLVGVDCYEDILEEMGREEVEKIGTIVEESVHELFPRADVTVMGSYRRGKLKCGDVDIHITCEDFDKQVPEKALGEIVDLLWKRGHIAFHLTFISGMRTGSDNADYAKSARYIPENAWKSCKDAPKYKEMRNEEHSSLSYMGVFRSPSDARKRRRVDIKFYPYRERVFAELYFTGNGHFNRSMRLWAARKFDFTLNDHGLFRRGTQDRVIEASKEKDIFDKLGLLYLEPPERTSFHAVIAKDNSESAADLEMTQSDFQEDSKHSWID